MKKYSKQNLLAASIFKSAGVAITLVPTMTPSMAVAQESPALVLEEVVVTAQKRVESLQDVPSSINAISGEALKDYNVQNFTDVEQLTPGLDITKTTGRNGSISLRGISFDPSSAADAAVTVYWNEVLVDGGPVFQQLFDVERVEVLRGPQGTLQGRSSPAGAINIHTVKPTFEGIAGNAKVTLQDNDGFNTQFGLNVPLVEDVLAMRVSGVYDESAMDQIENVATGNESDDQSSAGRASFAWLASDSLSVDLHYEYLRNDVDNINVLEGEPLNSGMSGSADPSGLLKTLDAFDRKGVLLGSDVTQGRYQRTALSLNWELEGHLLTAVSGYTDSLTERVFDQADGNTNPDYSPLVRKPTDDTQFISQEIRLSSTESEFWEYMVGAYYEKNSGDFIQENGVRPNSANYPGSTQLNFPFIQERFAAFSHNTLFLTDQLSAQIGLRWQTNSHRRNVYLSAGSEGIAGYEPGEQLSEGFSKENKKENSEALTGAISLQYALDDPDVVLYTSFSTGYRPGGVTVTGNPLPEEDLIYGEENSQSLELGFKSKLWEGRAQLNGALFYQRFDDLITRRTGVNVQRTTGGIREAGITSNADTELKGAELEFNGIVMENWVAGGGLSYVDATNTSGSMPCNLYLDDGSTAAIAVDSNGNPVMDSEGISRVALAGSSASFASCDVSDKKISSQPRWSASLNTEYTIPFDVAEAYLRALYKFTGGKETLDAGSLSAYSTTDLYLGMRSGDWDVSLFARNLFNKEAVHGARMATETVGGNVSPVHTGYGERSLIPQRVLGLSASYYFE